MSASYHVAARATHLARFLQGGVDVAPDDVVCFAAGVTARSSLSAGLVHEQGWDANLAVHRVFERYVEALFGGLDGGGLETLVLAIQFRRELSHHMRFEERVVLPMCRGVPAEVVANVLRDHGLIRAGFERLEELALLRVFDRVDARLLRHALVQLDRMLDHHDDRETDALYGPLEIELDADERARLLDGLAQVSLREVPTRAELEEIAQHACVRALAARYRAWLEGRPLDPVAVEAFALPTACRAALPKLLARDDQVVRRERTVALAPLRERAVKEMLAEVSLRSSLLFVISALVGER